MTTKAPTKRQQAAQARQRAADESLYKAILAEIEKGLAIQVTTYLISRVFTKASQFKLCNNGVFAQRGKNWDCISVGCSIRSVRI